MISKKAPILHGNAKCQICVLGNSHVAALKGGWHDGANENVDLRPDFYGCLASGMASLTYTNGKLGPSDPKAAEFFRNISGLGEFIDPNDYDAFILCGMGMYPTAIFNNYASFATPTSNNRTAPHLVSDECMKETLWEDLERSMMFHCARLVRSVTDKPVYIAWQAFLSEKLFEIEWRRDQITPIIENKDQIFVQKAMESVEDRLTDEGFTFLKQPDHTIADGIMTRAKYSRGSVLFREELTKEHRENDVFHMNSDYGRACWDTWVI